MTTTIDNLAPLPVVCGKQRTTVRVSCPGPLGPCGVRVPIVGRTDTILCVATVIVLSAEHWTSCWLKYLYAGRFVGKCCEERRIL